MKSFQAIIIASIFAVAAAANEPVVASPAAATNIERELAEYEKRHFQDQGTPATSPPTPDIPRPQSYSYSYGGGSSSKSGKGGKSGHSSGKGGYGSSKGGKGKGGKSKSGHGHGSAGKGGKIASKGVKAHPFLSYGYGSYYSMSISPSPTPNYPPTPPPTRRPSPRPTPPPSPPPTPLPTNPPTPGPTPPPSPPPTPLPTNPPTPGPTALSPTTPEPTTYAPTLPFPTFAPTNPDSMRIIVTKPGFPPVLPFTINVMPSDTILVVKNKIQDRRGYPVDKQRLDFDGQILDNANTVSYYNIQDESFLVLSVST